MGQYNLSELTRYKELGRVKPSRTIVQAVWIEGDGGANPSKLILPSHGDGKIEVDIATPETVGYYGASLGAGISWWRGAGNSPVRPPGLSSRELPRDRTLHTAKFLEGSGLVRDHSIHVPNQSTIYTPGGVMHTNNYLQGTWRTMLADGPINEAKMYRNDEKFNFIIWVM